MRSNIRHDELSQIYRIPRVSLAPKRDLKLVSLFADLNFKQSLYIEAGCCELGRCKECLYQKLSDYLRAGISIWHEMYEWNDVFHPMIPSRDHLDRSISILMNESREEFAHTAYASRINPFRKPRHSR
jgi:hypothetical protein